MAVLTPAQLQTALGTNGMNALMIRATEVVSGLSVSEWLVEGMCDAPGRVRWVRTNVNEGTLTQALSIFSAMRGQWK